MEKIGGAYFLLNCARAAYFLIAFAKNELKCLAPNELNGRGAVAWNRAGVWR